MVENEVGGYFKRIIILRKFLKLMVQNFMEVLKSMVFYEGF